ncbi:alpha/beta-hydrolase [Hypoxylon fragiforme]|uniref:alpha/beta-hydrolase n=1 Tax=Hypoxylon fragiforme TaxID=63214 RepID=UPI0020C681EF|nr:alpha/beta-hydrolase [Hypoxylon fragiforme]KAI2603495.1 alpha/beta-hydrolase [Hypoxylon fragiforme]
MASLKTTFLVLCQLFYLAIAVSPVVDLGCTKYVGVAKYDGISQWLGMRFASPPVGNLRFRPPIDPPCNFTTQAASQHGAACIATGASLSSTTSEDCLYIDVFAPSDATPESKLPVYFFIQGGGFNALSNLGFDGSGLIRASGNNMIVVTFNYRVGVYGFMTNGPWVSPNNGLHDQRKAMEWVKRHISKFGGDPNHVVLGGDSAGAASISLHMVAYGGRETNLFHAAAAESVSFGPVLTVEQSQYQYDSFSSRLNCSGPGLLSLSCLRSKTTAQLQAANVAIPYPGESAAPLYMWNPVIDGDLIRDHTYTAYAEGRFVKIPLLVGADTNDGTIFTPRNTSTLVESENFIRSQFSEITEQQLQTISELYPNPNDTCPSAGCYWRQVSNAYGDMRYMCPVLYISSAAAPHRDTFTYRYNVEDPRQIADGLGVPHTIELNAIWGAGYTNGSPPSSYAANGTNALVTPVVQAYWTSFIRTFDPNTHRHPGAAQWETWDAEKQNRLLFSTGGVTEMEAVDQDTRTRCEYLGSIGVAILQR